MMSFLFWNLGKKHLLDSVAALALNYDIDILMLVENIINPIDILNALNNSSEPSYHYSPCLNCNKVYIFTKFSSNFITIKYETPRLTIRQLKLPGRIEFLLAVTHFIDKGNYKSSSQHEEAESLAENIREIENDVGHSRTVLVGDLNMSPFDDGVVGARALHGVMSRRIASNVERRVQNKCYSFFYNPMWCLFNDGTRGPPGTYYCSESEHVAFFWYMFDQVMVRPELIDKFNIDSLHIVESDGFMSFLSQRGTPIANVSDHLPITFRIEI